MNDTIARIRYNTGVRSTVRLIAYAVTWVILFQLVLSFGIMMHQVGPHSQLNIDLYGQPYPWEFLIGRQWSLWWTATWANAFWASAWTTFIMSWLYFWLHMGSRWYAGPSRALTLVLTISTIIVAVGFIDLGRAGINI